MYKSSNSTQSAEYQGRSRMPTFWRGFIFFIIIILLSVSLRVFNLIPSTLLNQMGIVLNFMAGFLVAPELLGSSVLTEIEKQLKSALSRTRKFTAHHKEWSYIKGFAMVASVMIIVAYLIVLTPEGQKVYHFSQFVVIIAPYAIGYGVLLLATVITTFLLAILLDNLTTKLAGSNRLRRILVWWGILFFTTGNLLQLLSTL